MADIFVSYARADKERVAPLVAALEAEGFSVWWDPAINPGQEFDELISNEIKQARAVIVVWTPASVSSRWVRGEARIGAERGILIPVRFDQAELPIDARSLHTTDLDGWREDRASAPYQDLLRALKAFLGRTDIARPETHQQPAHVAAPVPLWRRFELWQIGVAAGAVLVLIVGGLFFARQESRGDAETRSKSEVGAPAASEASSANSAAPEISSKPRIAVLPFENLSPDQANAFFADGMHEEILSTLANRAPGLEVIARTTMMLYRDEPKPVSVIAGELGATHILEGTVRRDGEQMRLTLQLIDAKSQGHLWSQSYDRPLKNALTLQSEVAAVVASQLAVELDQSALNAGAMTHDPEAYDYYLKARLRWQLVSPASTAAEYQEMDRLLTLAIEKDPDFGLAYFDRAMRNMVAATTLDPNPERLRKARDDLAVARKLLGDDPNVRGAEALLGTSSSSMTPLEAAERLTAAEADGMNDGSLLIAEARILSLLGRYEESRRILERLLALDPGNLNVLGQYQGLLLRMRKPAEALKVLDIMIERFKAPLTPILRAKVIFDYTGRTDEWRAALDRYGGSIDPAMRLSRETELLLYEHAFDEILQHLAVTKIETLRQESYFPTVPIPISFLRGWTKLLMNDRVGAKEDGTLLLRYTAKLSTPEGPLRLSAAVLEAHGRLMTGDHAGAIALQRQLLAVAPPDLPEVWPLAANSASRVFAWAGEEDAAVDLLERLATVPAGLSPAEIVRDPSYAIPLAKNERYQALKAKLEAQMAATQLE